MTRFARFTCLLVEIGVLVAGACGDARSGSPATSALDEATQLGRLVEELHRAGRFQDAVAPAERGLQLRERALGPLDPAVAASLNRLAELHLRLGAYGKAEPLVVRALEIGAKTLGPAHPAVATSLGNLAEVHHARGEYDKAGPLYARALDIREKALGPAHPDVARSMSGVAALHRDQGEYDEAEPLYRRALELIEKALGPMHPDVARIASNLGKLYRMVGAYDKAQPLHARAVDIAEKTLAPGHPDVAQYLNELATVHWAQGAYRKAEPLYVRALEITEKAFGPMHRDVARSLTNLGLVLQDQGAHGKAEPLYVRALEIAEKVLGPTHPNTATIMNNLATLYWDQGAFDKAEQRLVRALDIAEKALGPWHADVGQSAQNLATLYASLGVYEKAESLFARALEVTEKAVGPSHLEVARVLRNLAWLYRHQARYSQAEPLLVRALAIETALGPVHPRSALTLQTLAAVYRDQGDYAKAAPLVARALELVENAFSPMHPQIAVALQAAGMLAWTRDAFEDALPALARAAEIREAQLRVELPRLSEPRKRALMAVLQAETDAVMSLHAHALPRDPRALELALATALRRKGRILDSLVDNETALRAHLTPELRTQLDQLGRARSELVAQLYTLRDATDRAAVAAVRARIEDLEAALSAASSEFRAQSEPVTVASVKAALPPDAALVELVRYHRVDPKHVQQSREERYVAYLVMRNRPPRWVALGAAPPIDAQVDALLAAMDDPLRPDSARAVLRRLDELVLAPIRARLTGVSHLILAPDGKLNLVPFEALIDARGRHALESYLINYVTTGRDLLRFGAPRPRSAAVIVAGPDYGPVPPAPALVSFAPLAGSLGEAADLQKYFPMPPLTGGRATKSALGALVGPALIHIVTHGFYAQARSAGRAQVRVSPVREVFADPNSPLLPPPHTGDPADGLDRAGLAMAGANQGAAGIVTAREIAGFDWWGTQLVVLSACETGIGAVPSGDGVYGMRRALVLAGAASQVVSLWAVDDASTRMLMRDYYAELARGSGRAEALRTAKLALSRLPQYAHPHHWAAFIPAGDWRPLDKNMITARANP